LLGARALVNICDDYGLQPTHHASSNKTNGLVVVNELLAYGANPNAPSACGTPLHFASNRGSLDTVKRLLSAGADINARDPDDDSPAMVTLLCWNQSIFSCLMHAGAKLNHVRKTGEDILHLVTWAGSTETWNELSTYASTEQTSGLDVRVPHNGHGLTHCFDHCRNLWYVGERETMADEVAKFRHMIYTFEDNLKIDV
jgi:ankyrin repeat protein